MSMIRTSLLSLASALLIATSAFAASEADYKAALSAAEAANKQAAGVRNQWTTTAATINAAKKFAETGDFDKATAAANRGRSAGQGIDLPGHQRKGALERHGNPLSEHRCHRPARPGDPVFQRRQR